MKTKLIKLSLILGVLIALFIIPQSVSAATEGNYTYTVTNEEATISSFSTSVKGAIVIPDTLGGYPVTSIGDCAFYGCTGLTEVTIPDSVTSIGEGAFRECDSLEEITLPFVGHSDASAVSYDAVFGYIFGRSSSSSTTNCVLQYCGPGRCYYYYIPSSLRKVTITKDTGFSYGAFHGCSKLTEINISDSVTSIGDYTFNGCTGLTDVTIPNSVTSIGRSAFYGCSKLTEINISDSVTSIGDYTFYGCTGLTDVTIPNSVTSIGGYAFRGCTGLTEITIPNSVTSIGDYAFYNCSNLKVAWYLGNKEQWNSVSVGTYHSPLTNCVLCMGEPCGENLTWDYNDGVLTISGSGDMMDWTSSSKVPWYAARNVITKVIIPEGVTSIGDYAFNGCTGLTEVTIPDSVTTIGYCAFEGCTGLTKVMIPEGVTWVADYAFQDCTALTDISIGNSVTDIGYKAFYNTAYYNNSENWENGVLYIVKHLIKANEEIAGAYNIKEGTLAIAYNAFENCELLTEITIPEGVTSIRDYAFNGCTGLTEVTIPNSVVSIGEGAFEDCTGLTKVNITDLSVWCGISFEYREDNPLYYAGNLYVNNTLVTELVIPDGITSIGDYAFAGCTSLTELTIPNSVTSIGSSAFYGCTGLVKTNISDLKAWCGIIFADNPIYYSKNLYLNRELITELVLPDTITTINNSAFANCKSLTKVVIPDSVTHIGRYAFAGCTGLEEITLPFVGTELSPEYPYLSVLGTIFGGEDDCYTANQQISSQETRSYLIPNSLKRVTVTNQEVIPYGAFSGCIGLEEVVLSEKVEELSTNAFLNCDKLELVTFYNKDTKIARTNFVGCDNAKISGYTGSTSEKFADAYLYEFIPLSEATSEYTITHKNLVSGASSITLDVCVTSPEKMGGKIYVALYDDNHMIQVKVYDAEEIVNATLDFAKGTYIKVMWWDNDHKPIVENLKIDL